LSQNLNASANFGFWILDFGFCSGSVVFIFGLGFRSQVRETCGASN
jgi:hypothetical protein